MVSFSLIGDDSDSESQTSSTEEGLSPHAGAGLPGSRGQQKRPRKKPAPQAPRNAAIPVAMPKAPSVIPPKQMPPPAAKMEPEFGMLNIFTFHLLKRLREKGYFRENPFVV